MSCLAIILFLIYVFNVFIVSGWQVTWWQRISQGVEQVAGQSLFPLRGMGGARHLDKGGP